MKVASLTHDLTESIINNGKKELKPETIQKLRSVENDSSKIIKSEMSALLQNYKNLTEKFMSIPKEFTSASYKSNQREMCNEQNELKLMEKAEIVDKVVKQQALMIAKMESELEHYENAIKENCEIDDGLCCLIENNLANVGLQDEEAIINIASKVAEA